MQGNIIQVAICSPSDLLEERTAIPPLFTRWNAANTGVFLQPRMWESDSAPELGDHPQHILNDRLLPDCDLLVAMFWTRLGTPTPTAKSGTVEEIREFIKLKGPKRVMVYYCDRALSPSQYDSAEMTRVKGFQEEMRSQGLYGQFADLQDFEKQLYQHLDMKVRQLLANELPLPIDSADTASSGTPSQEQSTPQPADPRLHQPMEFGTTLEDIAKGFAKKMDEFDTSGMGRDKYLGLGAHVFCSVASCLDRFLSFSAHSTMPQDRDKIDRISSRLKQLATTYGGYVQKIPSFWKEGRQISDDLTAHQNYLVQMRR